jgi:hypothetical protein
MVTINIMKRILVKKKINKAEFQNYMMLKDKK